jgi:small GTP-binding protein
MSTFDPLNLRIITTLGHVDHGKTTLMDSLLAANNIVSAKMAGKMRYLDSRDDEQERGITMESSAVSLKFTVLQQAGPQNFVLNVIDTPGHVDFSSEVSSASRLCDGALVLVDVVEGVCTQVNVISCISSRVPTHLYLCHADYCCPTASLARPIATYFGNQQTRSSRHRAPDAANAGVLPSHPTY